VGKILYPNGDIYFGQHKGFSREGQGKLIDSKGSMFEGNWEQDRRNGKGRFVDGVTGDVYIGEYIENKRSIKGRQLYKALGQIYDGEWSNDKRQGEGTILNEAGEIMSGDFRADHMEGKLTYQRTLQAKETERVFNYMLNSSDSFINVSSSSKPMVQRRLPTS
jgi:hypothetical protein